jgi:hypothetical protein
MVNPIRIKEYIFPQVTVSGTNINFNSTNFPINGQILKITVNPTATGSLVLTESGTYRDIFNAKITSGPGYQNFYPRTPVVSNANSLVGGSLVDYFALNNNLLLIGSTFTSGTSAVFGPVIINYI